MIDSVSLKHFKSHAGTSVVFHPGVNVLVGPSDHGKTNIIRAINWVANNRPLGDGTIQRNYNQASVDLVVSHAKGDETATIRRVRGGRVNEYVLDGAHPFTAFGSDPPPQIRDVLNLSDINLQRQFEPYFLVFDPPGQVAEFIRSITKLDEIDLVIEYINGGIRHNHIDVAVCENELADTLRNLGFMVRVDIDGLQQRVNRVKQLIEHNQKTAASIERLVDLVEQIDTIKPIHLPDDLDRKFDAAKNYVESLTNLRLIISRMTVVINHIQSIKQTFLPNDLDRKIELMKQMTDRTKKLQSDITRLNEIVTSIQLTSLGVIPLPDITEILDCRATLEREYNERMKKRDRLIDLIKGIQKVTEQNYLLLMDQRAVEGEIEDLRGWLTTCPTCGSVLNEESKERLLNESN